MARRLLLAATGAVALAAAGLGTTTANAAAPAASSAKITTVHSCAKASKGSCAVLRRRAHRRGCGSGLGEDGVRCQGWREPERHPERLRPGRPARRLQADRPRAAAARPSRSSTPTTTRPPRRTSAVYRAQYGLPACTTANGCFKKVNQNGAQASYPRKDGGWAQEISLDLDMVERDLPRLPHPAGRGHLGVVRQPGRRGQHGSDRLGAKAISNSYGGGDASDVDVRRVLQPPGHRHHGEHRRQRLRRRVPRRPRAYVTAVGGTHLVRDAATSRGWTRDRWSGRRQRLLRVQHRARPGRPRPPAAPGAPSPTSRRSPTPRTGVAVYDSTAYQGHSGWLVFGGTSVVVADHRVGLRAGGQRDVGELRLLPLQPHRVAVRRHQRQQRHAAPRRSGAPPAAGWDGPTGLGTPNGTGAF